MIREIPSDLRYIPTEEYTVEAWWAEKDGRKLAGLAYASGEYRNLMHAKFELLLTIAYHVSSEEKELMSEADKLLAIGDYDAAAEYVMSNDAAKDDFRLMLDEVFSDDCRINELLNFISRKTTRTQWEAKNPSYTRHIHKRYCMYFADMIRSRISFYDIDKSAA